MACGRTADPTDRAAILSRKQRNDSDRTAGSNHAHKMRDVDYPLVFLVLRGNADCGSNGGYCLIFEDALVRNS
jgi:hypothetical protein